MHTRVRIPYGSPLSGGLAQLGEHLPYKQRVTGSNPVTPTTRKGLQTKSFFYFQKRTGSNPHDRYRGTPTVQQNTRIDLILSNRIFYFSHLTITNQAIFLHPNSTMKKNQVNKLMMMWHKQMCCKHIFYISTHRGKN